MAARVAPQQLITASAYAMANATECLRAGGRGGRGLSQVDQVCVMGGCEQILWFSHAPAHVAHVA